jgi:transposase
LKRIKYIGLDVHKNSISISTVDEGRNAEVRYYHKIGNDMDQLMKVFGNSISKGLDLRCAYEAGCCGYYLYRFLTGNDVRCEVVAPSKIPRNSCDRLKNDKRDSITLARLVKYTG